MVLLDGFPSVEPQSETNWRLADQYRVPRLIFANKMDKVGADFYECVKSVTEKLGVQGVPIQLPIGTEGGFEGIVDLVIMKAYKWHGEELGAKFDVIEIPDDLKEKAKQYHDQLIEALADHDDELAAKFLEGKPVSVEEIKKVMRKAVIGGAFFPMMCGSSARTRRMQPCWTRSATSAVALDVPPRRAWSPTPKKKSPANAKMMRLSRPWRSRFRAIPTSENSFTSGSTREPLRRAPMSSRQPEHPGARGPSSMATFDKREEVDELYAGDIGAGVGF